MDALKLTAAEIAAQVGSKKISALEVAKTFVQKTRAHDGQVKAFLHFSEEKILQNAREVDDKIASGAKPGSLAGVPVAIKDNIAVTGQPLTCASKILQKFTAPYDATVIQKLKAEGAVLFGKTNLDEFAMGSSTENSAYQVTKNPWDLARVPGGSSGGSAAAVAAGFAPLALGSDTGGSIRQPASFCGIWGLKPTYGRVSRFGLVAFASSLDQIGPFARNARDCALLLQALCGRDPNDSTSSQEAVPNFTEHLDKPIRGLKLGLPKEYFLEGLNPEVKNLVMKAVDALKKQGAVVEEISLPHTKFAIAVYYLLATAEASSNLARFDGVRYGYRSQKAKNLLELYELSRSEGFGAEVKRRIMLGTYALSSGYYDAYYGQAQKVRTLIRRDFENAFKKVDVIVTPTSPTVAFQIGEKSTDPLSMYLSDIYTISCNLAGLPGLSAPCGQHQNLPAGIQFLGRPFDEKTLLQLSQALERELPAQTSALAGATL